jgi:methyltransferase (TIGR00027 family)
MASSPIEHVSDTAFWVATYRANEGLRPDALFADPLAERLVEGRGRAIAEAMPGGEFTAWMIAIRTCIIDRQIEDAVAAGIDTVLNLGAGLDTRPYRMELPPTLHWIEVDFASTIDFKEERLAGEKPRCRLDRRRVDLSDADARRALLAEIDTA